MLIYTMVVIPYNMIMFYNRYCNIWLHLTTY